MSRMGTISFWVGKRDKPIANGLGDVANDDPTIVRTDGSQWPVQSKTPYVVGR